MRFYFAIAQVIGNSQLQPTTIQKIHPGVILRGLLLIFYMILILTTPLTAVILSLSGFGVSQTR